MGWVTRRSTSDSNPQLGDPGGCLPGRAAGRLACGSELQESRRRSRPLAPVLEAGTAFIILQVRASSTVRPGSRPREMGPPLPATRLLQQIRAEPGTQGPIRVPSTIAEVSRAL